MIYLTTSPFLEQFPFKNLKLEAHYQELLEALTKILFPVLLELLTRSQPELEIARQCIEVLNNFHGLVLFISMRFSCTMLNARSWIFESNHPFISARLIWLSKKSAYITGSVLCIKRGTKGSTYSKRSTELSHERDLDRSGHKSSRYPVKRGSTHKCQNRFMKARVWGFDNTNDKLVAEPV